jgi:hypothetical protein
MTASVLWNGPYTWNYFQECLNTWSDQDGLADQIQEEDALIDEALSEIREGWNHLGEPEKIPI